MYNLPMKIFSFGKKTYLMHKDIEVLCGKYDAESHKFSNVKILNESHLPHGSFKNNEFDLHALNHWIYWRGIPNYRLGLSSLLGNLNIKSSHSLLENTNHLSVSDAYWIKEDGEDISYAKNNFFRQPYDQNGFARAMFANSYSRVSESALYTPNNTLNGFQRKAWMKDGNQLVLYKGGTSKYQQEPINEWLASRIMDVLNIPHVHYDVSLYEDHLVSVCPNLCNTNIDLIPARDILGTVKLDPSKFHLSAYLNELKKNGIRDADQRMDDLLLIDYLLLNTDRHDQNLGVLVDANTNQMIQVAPIYDTGTCLGALLNDNQIENSADIDNCRMFNAKHFNHKRLLSLIMNKERYDIGALKSIPQEYGNMLVKYQPYTNMSNDRIEALYTLLYKQILSLLK